MIKYLLIFLFFLISCEKNTHDNLDTIKADKLYNEGIGLLQKDAIESYKKFQLAISYYNKNKDYSNISKSLICQAIAQKNSGDIFGAEATLVEALKIMTDNDESLFSVYDTMANLKLDQKEYAEAIKWYNKALTQNIVSEESKISILNNKSVASFRSGNNSEALNILKKINLTKIVDPKLKNRIKDNIEYIKWLNNKNYPVEEKIERIAELKKQDSDFWGLNSSYAHLADINKDINAQKSLYYAKKMLDIAKINKSPEDRLEAIERIILVDTPLNSKKHFNDYKLLSDSIQKSRNDYRTRFAYIKYDSEKKNAENQTLKVEKTQNENRIIILIGALILAIIIIIWFRKRQIRLKQENELKIKNNQLKLSKKVHDVVANGIYQVMAKIENQENIDKNEMLDELEFVYEKSRDISYEKIDSNEGKEDFSKKISELIASFKNESINTYVAGNDETIWKDLKVSSQEEAYQIIRELLVNMKKHSQADRVVFKFERINNFITISYTDNGIGISGELIYKNGLTSTVSRIENVRGEIIFDTETEKGLKITISFPI